MIAAPRWKTALDTALKNNRSVPVFQLATATPEGQVRVRSHVFRGFMPTSASVPVSALKEDPNADESAHNDAARRARQRPLLVTTTDARSAKAVQIGAEPRVELVWWFATTEQQFRVAGRAYLVGPAGAGCPKEEGEEGEGKAAAVAAEWERRRRELYDDVGGHIRAAWCRPTPGTLLADAGGAEGARAWPVRLPPLAESEGDERARRLTEVALENFALVLVEPEEVDYVELGVIPNRRTRFTWAGRERGWEETPLVP